MGIETSLERVANALERIASTLEENTNVNDWYKGYLLKKDAAKGVEAALAEAHVDAAPEPAAPATDAPATQPEMSYDELKAFLIARGVEIPKGTKTTTLKKLYEKHKNTAPIDTVSPDNVAVMQPVSAQDVAVPKAPEAPAADPFDLPGVPAEPAPAPEQKPMTKDEAGDRIRKVYQATEEHRKAFVEALTAVGVPAGGSFQDVPEGKFDLLVETFEKLIGVANA